MAILNKEYTLSLNKSWQPIDTKTIGDAIIKMTANTKEPALAVDISFNETVDEEGNVVPIYDQIIAMQPLPWEQWIQLDVRPYHKAIKTGNGFIRAPLVIINRKYNKVPMCSISFNKKGVWQRDKGVDQYTGQQIPLHEASIDHVIPKSRGGKNTWDNVVITNKKLNNQKGNKLNKEIGLKLLSTPTKPKRVPRSATISNVHQIPEWQIFIK